MNKTPKCQAVCEHDIHADHQEAAPACDLHADHDKPQGVDMEVFENGAWVTYPNADYIAGTPHRCDECWNDEVAAYEAAYELAYYGE